MLTIVCTESTSGVASAASSTYPVAERCHVRAEPFQPSPSTLYTQRSGAGPVFLSRSVARSGTSPRYQKTSEIVKYVLIASTSQKSGERKFTHSGPRVFGY